MEQLKKAILIDLDGTVCDSRIPISYLNGERDTDNYDVYFRILDKVTPNKSIITSIIENCTVIGGDRADNWQDNFADITLVFLTSRNAGYYSMMHTMKFVEENFKLPLSSENVKADFYFRPINYHCPSLQYKMEKFSILKNMYHFVHIYEDEFPNVEMFYKHKQEKCLVHWVKNSYNFALTDISQKISLPLDKIIIHKI